LAGLSSAIKWHGLFLLPLIAGAIIFRFVRRSEGGVLRVLRLGAISAAGALAGFALLSPYALLKPADTWTGLLANRVRYARGAWPPPLPPALSAAERGLGIRFHTMVTLPAAIGGLALLFAVFGAALAIRRRRAAIAPVLIAVLLLYVVPVGPTR